MPEPEPKYIQPTPRGRLAALILILAMIISGLAIPYLVDSLTPPERINPGVEELRQDLRQLTAIAVCLCIGGIMLSLVIAAYLLHLGRHPLQRGTFPPAGAFYPVLVKTRVLGGERALRLGRYCRLAAGLFLLTVVPWLYMIWWFIHGA